MPSVSKPAVESVGELVEDNKEISEEFDSYRDR